MRTVDKTIEELAEAAKAGDAAAEDRLFSLLERSFLLVAKYRIRNLEDAEDIVHDALGTALCKYKSAELAKGFLPWAFLVLRNKIGNYYMKKARCNLRTFDPTDSNTSWQPVSGIITPDRFVELMELEERLKQAISRMEEPCRKILSLLLTRAPRSEIQREFPGIPMSTVDTRIHNCRKKLRAMREIRVLLREYRASRNP